MPEYASAFDSLGRTPAETEQLKLRATLMRALRTHISKQGWTQTEAAEHFGVGQPRISDLMRGKVSKFSVDKLAEMIGAVGLHIEARVLVPEAV